MAARPMSLRIFWPPPAENTGKSCPWGRRATAIRLTSAFPPLRESVFYRSWEARRAGAFDPGRDRLGGLGADAQTSITGSSISGRFPLLEKAFARFERSDALDEFSKNREWLLDYALFMALKDHFGGKAWTEWPDEQIRLRKPKAVETYAKKLSQRVRFHCFLQFLFFEQWNELREYVKGLGIGIIGDLPIYVPLDSADVWARPEAFLLDGDRNPLGVAGVPPDYFNADGQLWGNPLYDWAYLQKTGYSWWMARVSAAASCFDVIRLDHFRGFAITGPVLWRQKPPERRNGKRPGQGLCRREAAFQIFPSLPRPGLSDQRSPRAAGLFRLHGDEGAAVRLRFPGAFRPPAPATPSPAIPAPTTTTAAAWDAECGGERSGLRRPLPWPFGSGGFNWEPDLRGGMGSVADLFVAQIPGLLGLGGSAPGCAGESPRQLAVPGGAGRMRAGI